MILLKFRRPPTPKFIDLNVPCDVVFYPKLNEDKFCYARVQEVDIPHFIKAYSMYTLDTASPAEMPDYTGDGEIKGRLEDFFSLVPIISEGDKKAQQP